MDRDDQLDFGLLLPRLRAVYDSGSGPHCTACGTCAGGRIIGLRYLAGVSVWLTDLLGFDAIVICPACHAVRILPLGRLMAAKQPERERWN